MSTKRSKQKTVTIPRATGGITRLAFAQLKREQIDLGPVLGALNLTLDQIEDPSARIEARSQVKTLELAARLLKDELLGFHLAQSFDLRELGLTYYVMASSERLIDALRNVERYSRIVNQGVKISVGLEPDPAISLAYVGFDREGDRHHIEFWLVTLIRLCRELTGVRLAPSHVKACHSRERVPKEFKPFFGVDVEFNSLSDTIVLPRNAGEHPIVGRDPYLNNMLRRYAEEEIESVGADSFSIRSNVERAISELLPHGKASASAVARRLAMSQRTLARKLAREGVTYTGILDQLRASLARRHLGDKTLRISEVAWLLGYQEVASFTHAFRRWTGKTPMQFRAISSGA
jgi:AraC-like DNA-binding protein